MKKKYNWNAKEILQIIDTIPAPTGADIDRAKVAAITCKTATEFAEFLDLNTLAFKAWCNTYPEYQRAVNSWRDHTTNEVEAALAKKAIGFTKKTKKDVITRLGTVETLITETYYPPDPTAAQFWLKNRKPEDWQDKKEVDVNVNANIRAWLVSTGINDPTEVIDLEPTLVEETAQLVCGQIEEEEARPQLEAEIALIKECELEESLTDSEIETELANTNNDANLIRPLIEAANEVAQEPGDLPAAQLDAPLDRFRW